MISKILKAQLLFLFLITILSLTGFYFFDVLPDNYLKISSSNAGIGYISYFFSSLLAFTSYFGGPWLFILFVAHAIFHTFLYSHRLFRLDAVSLIFLTPIVLLMTYFAVPDLVGPGLHYFVKSSFDTLEICALFFICVVAFLALNYRQSFKDKVMGAAHLAKDSVTQVNWQKLNVKEMGVSPDNFKTAWAKMKERAVASFGKKPKKDEIGQAESEGVAATEKEVPQPSAGEKSIPRAVRNVSQIAYVANEEEVGEEDDSSPVAPIALDYSGPAPHPAIAKRNADRRISDSEYHQLLGQIPMRKNQHKTTHPDEQYFTNLVQRIEEKLAEFKIDGQIINVLKGPVVDTFELELGPGMKVSKITSSAQDLSLALYGAPIRIVYPMKGRTTIGIEVPRNPREIIYLDEVLASNDYSNNNTNLPVAMGKDAFGQVFVVDLAAMPHMLVAGATGAGKSVFINTLLVSLLVKKSPLQMRLILIDPKQLELALYSKLPHLIMPVITEPKRACLALLWAVEEMERRYKILKELGVRNIEGFNEKVKSSGPTTLGNIRHLYQDIEGENYELPYIVVIVDEFADLILTKAGKEIENNICRLAAKARASGIHLVLATQRPSVDVITGLIKSNFPTRVSFRVTTDVDSRTILNAVGAEKLLGKGDMLYKHGVETTRVHASYVDEKEIEELTDRLSSMECQYDENALEFLENEGQTSTPEDPYAYGSHIASVREEDGDDNLYHEAVKIVLESRMASASMLQRRLKIGYNRAANLVEEMETKGVVGPAQGSRPRKVLSAPEEHL